MTLTFRATLAAFLFLPVVLRAQVSPDNVRPGMRVRLVVADSFDNGMGQRHFTYPAGTVVVADHREMEIVQPDLVSRARSVTTADTLELNLSRIVAGEVFNGMRRHTVAGLLTGLVAGGALGYILGNAGTSAMTFCSSYGCGHSNGTQDKRGQDAAMGAAAGALVGGAIGYLVRSERWDRIRFAAAPTH